MRRLCVSLLLLFVSACSVPHLSGEGSRPHHFGQGFRNRVPDTRTDDLVRLIDLVRVALFTAEGEPGTEPVPRGTARPGWDAAGGRDGVMWLGHATVLLRIAGRTVLTDPVFGRYASPTPPFGPRRLFPPPLSLDELPHIDAIVVSHDHYDHFEPETIRRIAARDRPLCALPLRVGGESDLGCGRTVRLDWDGVVTLDPVELRLLPAQHDSGRGLFDRFHTLWGSWLISAPGRRVYFAGDTGYGPHFAEIGAAYGPIDLALLPIGAHLPRSANRHVHMTARGALRARADLHARAMLPIHWGTYPLGLEHPRRPLVELVDAMLEAGLDEARVWLPRPGETRSF